MTLAGIILIAFCLWALADAVKFSRRHEQVRIQYLLDAAEERQQKGRQDLS